MRYGKVGLTLAFLLFAGACLAAGSPYRLVDRSLPEDLARDLHKLEGDLFNDAGMFMEPEQLAEKGQPVDGLDGPLSMGKVRAMVKIQWKEDGQGASLFASTKKTNPRKGYEWLVELIEKNSPSEEARLRNLRTLGRIFETRAGSDLAQWQAWRTTALTIVGPIRENVFLNHTNGHAFVLMSFPQFPGQGR